MYASQSSSERCWSGSWLTWANGIISQHSKFCHPLPSEYAHATVTPVFCDNHNGIGVQWSMSSSWWWWLTGREQCGCQGQCRQRCSFTSVTRGVVIYDTSIRPCTVLYVGLCSALQQWTWTIKIDLRVVLMTDSNSIGDSARIIKISCVKV